MFSSLESAAQPLYDPAFPGWSLNTHEGVNTPNGNQATGLVIGGTNPGVLTYFSGNTYKDSIILNPEIQGDDFTSIYGIDAKQAADGYAKESPPNWAAVDAAYDFPTYKSLYLRWRDVLHAHIVVVQRTYPYWLGGTLTEEFALANGTKTNHTFPGTRPSFLQFLKTDPDVNANAWAGFSNVKPANWI